MFPSLFSASLRGSCLGCFSVSLFHCFLFVSQLSLFASSSFFLLFFGRWFSFAGSMLAAVVEITSGGITEAVLGVLALLHNFILLVSSFSSFTTD